MNNFDRARREILAALFMEYSRTSNALADIDQLKSRYPLRATTLEFFDPIVSEMEGHLTTSRTLDEKVSARIRPQGYGYVYRELLRELQAENLQIDHRKEEVISDSTNYEWFPIPVGWKWFQTAQEMQPSSGTKGAVIKDLASAELIPASDRMVTLDHNSPKYSEILRGIYELHEELRASNDITCSDDEKHRLLFSLSAARTLWEAAQLKVIQIKVGVILAIEEALAVLTKIGKAVGKSLLIDAIKSLVKHKTGLDI